MYYILIYQYYINAPRKKYCLVGIKVVESSVKEGKMRITAFFFHDVIVEVY